MLPLSPYLCADYRTAPPAVNVATPAHPPLPHVTSVACYQTATTKGMPMQLLYASPSLGFGHTLRIALEGEGIDAFCSDADVSMAGLGSAAAGVHTRVYVPSADYERALEVLERMLADEITSTPARPAVPRKPMPRWLVIVGAALAIAVVGAMVSQ